jgi:predicted transglutaminase-like cysteine proteinase
VGQLFGFGRIAAILFLSIEVSGCAMAPEPSSELPLGLPAAAPSGYLDMCIRLPDQCPEREAAFRSVSFAAGRTSVALDAARWVQLNAANTAVNQHVRYMIDWAWQPAVTAGDCKDFALAKRKLLWAAGWPADSLSIALVYSARTKDHAVLIANTNHGAYVLDNTTPWIMPWNDTDYSWLSAQDSSGQWRMAGETSHAVLEAAIATGVAPARLSGTDQASAVKIASAADQQIADSSSR